MADVILMDGKEITINLEAFTLEEYRGLFSRKETAKKSDETLAKACGMEYAELGKLNYLDYKKLLEALIAKCTKPLELPNFPSAST